MTEEPLGKYPKALSRHIVLEEHKFVEPKSQIRNNRDLNTFLKSATATDFMGFVLYLNDAAKSKTLSELGHRKDNVDALPYAIDLLKSILIEIRMWVVDIPPVRDNIRFGNPAYRTWYRKLELGAQVFIGRLLPTWMDKMHEQVLIELVPYFLNSFGNAVRIDYGTGHETTFVAFLYCMAKLGIFPKEDAPALVGVVFQEYLNTVRELQLIYCLEPAGSRGVWGLDDYQILPFMWGSSQLIDHPNLLPSGIHQQETLDQWKREYIYLQSISFIKQIKKGSFFETSPMLHDISFAESWQKINSGMIKLYRGELLTKVQVMQHFLFGTLLPFEM